MKAEQQQQRQQQRTVQVSAAWCLRHWPAGLDTAAELETSRGPTCWSAQPTRTVVTGLRFDDKGPVAPRVPAPQAEDVKSFALHRFSGYAALAPGASASERRLRAVAVVVCGTSRALLLLRFMLPGGFS